MKYDFALFFGWISFISLLLGITFYLQKRNYFLGIGYYSFFLIAFVAGTYIFSN